MPILKTGVSVKYFHRHLAWNGKDLCKPNTGLSGGDSRPLQSLVKCLVFSFRVLQNNMS